MAETDFKYDVFVSYSSANKDWVRKTFVPILEKAGLKVCIDFRDFVPGKPSRHNMRDACKESAYTVLVMTPAWIASEWTSFETLLTFLHDPSGKRQRTVPMMVEQWDNQIFLHLHHNCFWSSLFTTNYCRDKKGL